MKLHYLKYIAAITLTVLLNFNSFSQELSKTIKESTATFYGDLTGNSSAIKNYYTLNKGEVFKTYVINYTDGGYVITQESATGNKVIAFSEVGEYNIEGSPLEKILTKGYNKTKLNEFSNLSSKSSTEQSKTSVAGDINPFMSDVWGGVNCFDDNSNAVYPGNYYTPSHCSAGCVAISMSQVLHFYEWPITGMGSNTHSDNYNGSLKRHTMHFDAIDYDWTNMQDEYQGVASTDESRKAIGELYYSAATALEMNYEPSGSTSNINKTPFVYENFFRYTSHYEDVTWSSFWQRLYDNVQQGRPVPVAVDASATGDGHVFVVNGYKDIGGVPYYYLNWGWYDDGGINGWYNIQGWTTASSGYNTITGASFDLLPNPQITEIAATGSGTDFKVSWETSSKISVDEYTLEQKIDQGSWTTLAIGITAKEYTVSTATAGEVYQFRVKAKIQGLYYANSWSETEVYAVDSGYDGYIAFGGSQYAYARQTPNTDLDFTNDYTFETWIRLKDGNVNGNVILDQQYAFGLAISDVAASDYSVEFTSYASATTISTNTSGFKLSNDTWHHVAVSHSGSTTKLFVDGVLKTTDNSTNFNLDASNSALNMAEKYHGSYQGRIKADFNQLRISSEARYTANFTPTQNSHFSVDANTVAYFTFQNVHRVRFKDEAAHVSFKVSNTTNNAEWNFEAIANSITVLSTKDYELLQTSISLYPNPVTDKHFKITFKNNLNSNNVQVRVVDMLGKQINFKTTTNFESTEIFVSDATPSGIYFVQLIGDGFTATKKLIIQ